jgi:hypothetical protein|tara:strand:+ start:183 stop:497 length:315 start_codon:yes stop_codon:yes gene_type:complete
MKNLVLILICASLGFISGYLYFDIKSDLYSEKIISQEISLIEKYKAIPNCKQIRDNKDVVINELNHSEYLYWYYSSIESVVKKVIITNDMFVVYEESKSDCSLL